MMSIAKRIFPKPTISYEEELTDEPVVYLCNHSGAHGPAYATLYFNEPKTMWLIAYALDKKNNANFFFHDFFFGKTKKHPFFTKVLSKLVSIALTPLLKGTDHIPVYHDARMMGTFRQSVDALKNGKSVVIFPECPTKYSEFVNDLYSGFADLARSYYAATGKCIKFVPGYICHELHVVKFSQGYTYDPSINPKLQRKIISDYARDNIHRLASSLPKFTPAPFLPQAWYDGYGEYATHMADYWKQFD